MRLLDKMLHLLFPQQSSCLLCGQPAGSEALCGDCMEGIGGSRQDLNSCQRCGRYLPETGEDNDAGRSGKAHKGGRYCPECLEAPPAFFMARSLGPYRGDLKQVIYMYKYTGYRSLCRPLGLLLAELFLREKEFWDSRVIVPVPLSLEKMRTRGFNQSELLAERMGQLLNLPVVRCLLRTIDTPSQSKLTRQGRQDNIRGAFAINRQLIINRQIMHGNGTAAFADGMAAFAGGTAAPAGGIAAPAGGINKTLGRAGKVLLVDDILTTGATAGECSRVLLREGAQSISVITLASGLQEKM